MQHLVGLANPGVQSCLDRRCHVVDATVHWAPNLFAECFLSVLGAASPGGT
jgi:hypothetical protein